MWFCLFYRAWADGFHIGVYITSGFVICQSLDAHKKKLK